MSDEVGFDSYSKSPKAPDELQKKFAIWGEKRVHGLPISGIYSGNLFLVGGSPNYIFREYYMASGQKFQESAVTRFTKRDDAWHVAHVILFGEGQATISDRTENVDLIFEFSPRFNYIANLAKGYINASYDEQGKLQYLDFRAPKKQETHNDEPLMNDRNHNNLKVEKGEVVIIDKGYEILEMRLIDGDKVLLKRLEGDKVTDEITMPFVINCTELIETLVRPEVLEDPENANPELDSTWRFAHPLEVVGLTWRTHRNSRNTT